MNTPKTLPKNLKACNKCNKTIAKNHRIIQCYKCTSKIHIKCNDIDVKTYNKIKAENIPQLCYQCKVLPIPNPKCKCPVCSRTIAKNHRFIKCNLCLNKVHIRCNGTDEQTYNDIEKDNLSTICINCTDNFPFQNLTNIQLFADTAVYSTPLPSTMWRLYKNDCKKS